MFMMWQSIVNKIYIFCRLSLKLTKMNKKKTKIFNLQYNKQNKCHTFI